MRDEVVIGWSNVFVFKDRKHYNMFVADGNNLRSEEKLMMYGEV